MRIQKESEFNEIFDPVGSYYHSIMEKTYGRERAMIMLGIIGKERKRTMSTCKMCKQQFYSKSRDKVYCGKQRTVGTCSNTAMKQRRPPNRMWEIISSYRSLNA